MSGAVTPGRHVRVVDGCLDDVRPGDYWIDESCGKWMAAVPVPVADDDLPVLAALGNHDVEVRDIDGKITVSPSILVTGANGTEVWHGYLVAGEWREC